MASIKDLHILIVDDKEPVRKAVAAALGKIGFTNISATGDLLSAWKSIARQKVGLVICETVVDGKLGIHLLKKIRSTQAVARMPVLIMSTRKEPKVADAHMRAGASAFLVKPFDAATLLAKLKKALATPPKPPAGDNEKILLEQAKARLESYDSDGALTLFTKIARANPKCAAAYKGLAKIFQTKKNTEQSLVFLAAAAKASVQNGDFGDAEQTYNELRLYDPKAPNPFAAAGAELREKGDMKNAAELFRKAVAAEPDNAENFMSLADLELSLGNKDVATQRVTEALKLQDDLGDGRKLFKALTGQKWTDSELSVAGAQKAKKRQEEEEKRGTVRFWVPDLLVGVRGFDEHFAITEMSIKSMAFSAGEGSFEVGKTLKFDILRLTDVGTKPEIKGLKGEIMRLDKEAVGMVLIDPNEEQQAAIKEILDAAQERQKEEVRESKDITFDIDMLFM
ncbi:response regulator [Desulfocurvus sp. DL9XJH121]